MENCVVFSTFTEMEKLYIKFLSSFFVLLYFVLFNLKKTKEKSFYQTLRDDIIEELIYGIAVTQSQIVLEKGDKGEKEKEPPLSEPFRAYVSGQLVVIGIIECDLGDNIFCYTVIYLNVSWIKNFCGLYLDDTF